MKNKRQLNQPTFGAWELVNGFIRTEVPTQPKVHNSLTSLDFQYSWTIKSTLVHRVPPLSHTFHKENIPLRIKFDANTFYTCTTVFPLILSRFLSVTMILGCSKPAVTKDKGATSLFLPQSGIVCKPCKHFSDDVCFSFWYKTTRLI